MNGPETRQAISAASPHRRQDGQHIVVSCSASPILDERAQMIGAVALLQDISDRKELERQKDEFLAVVAHELKTPLASLKGYSQLLLRRAERDTDALLDETAIAMLRAADRQVNRLGRLVSGLLDFSRLQTGRLTLRRTTFSLGSLASDVVTQMQAAAPDRKISVLVQDNTVVEADNDRLEQVLINLVSNAVQATELGGRIEVRVWCQARSVIASVRDNGVGIREKPKNAFSSASIAARAASTKGWDSASTSAMASSKPTAARSGLTAKSARAAPSTLPCRWPMSRLQRIIGSRRIGRGGTVTEQMFFEDFRVGQVFKSASRTLTDSHFALFSAITGDKHPLHYDDEYCKQTIFGKRVAHGYLVTSMTALGASALSPYVEQSMIAYVEQSSRFLKPVLIGDTVRPQLEVAELIPRERHGILRLRTTIHNQHDELVLEGTQSYLVKRRSET